MIFKPSAFPLFLLLSAHNHVSTASPKKPESHLGYTQENFNAIETYSTLSWGEDVDKEEYGNLEVSDPIAKDPDLDTEEDVEGFPEVARGKDGLAPPQNVRYQPPNTQGPNGDSKSVGKGRDSKSGDKGGNAKSGNKGRDSSIHRFKLEHNLKQDFNPNLLIIDEGNTLTLLDGRVYALGDLEVMDIYASDAQYILDGEPTPLPPVTESRTLIGTVGGDTVMVTRGAGSDISTLDIFGPDGSDEYMAAVAPGVLAKITPNDLDPENTKKYTIDSIGLDDQDDHEPQSRHLRVRLQEAVNSKGAEVGTEGRSLQSGGCSFLRVIEVAAAFDSTFCARQGGETATRQEVERIIARSSVMYQQQSVCVRIVISHLEGYCTASQDPYRAGVNLNDIGCTQGRVGLLQTFQNYWRANRQSVRRDSAHLFYAQDLAGDSIGCAYINVLCNNDSAYGVNHMYNTDQLDRAALFTHELGHNIGLEHVNTASIMRPADDTITWDSTSVNALASLLPRHTCISTEQQSNYLTLRSAADTTMCFDVRGASTANGSRIWLYPCNGTPAQQFVHDSQNRLRSALNTNKCVVGNGGSTSSGTWLMIWDCVDNDTQYAFDRYTDGSMRARNDRNKCVDVNRNRPLDGQPTIVFWDCNGGNNQVWRW